jgi:hypothetical protein
MSRKWLILVLAAMMSVWSMAACDDDTDGDADADSDGDGDMDADSDVDGDGDGDWPCAQADAMAPQLRVTSLQLTAPPALSLPALQNIFDGAIDTFGFLWLVEADLTAGTMTTGSGDGTSPPASEADFCNVTWRTGYDPATANITYDQTAHTISTSAPIETMTIPIFSEGSLLLDLPLSQIDITDVAVNEDATLVGTPGATCPDDMNTCAANWTTDGTLTAWITWDAAMSIDIEALSMSLCNLLCGGDCTTVEPTACANPPTEIPDSGGTLGYQVEGAIGAGAVTIN